MGGKFSVRSGCGFGDGWWIRSFLLLGACLFWFKVHWCQRGRDICPPSFVKICFDGEYWWKARKFHVWGCLWLEQQKYWGDITISCVTRAVNWLFLLLMVKGYFFLLKKATLHQKLNVIHFKELLMCFINWEEWVCWEKSLFSPAAAEFSDFGVGLQSAAGLLGSLFSRVCYFGLPRSLKAFTWAGSCHILLCSRNKALLEQTLTLPQEPWTEVAPCVILLVKSAAADRIMGFFRPASDVPTGFP